MTITGGQSTGLTGTGSAEPPLLDRFLELERPIVMGILNVTPDSFSDGGHFIDPDAALKHAKWMIDEGADIIDVGGESTRPYAGARATSLEEELARLHDVLPAVIGLGTPVSIDTIKPEVALWALQQGAAIVNDVWGLQRDPNMARLVAEHGVPVVVMHNRYKADPSINIISDINAFFSYSLELAEKAGIARKSIVLDPGIGFGKTPEQSMLAITKLAAFKRFGLPILVGASRKRFINTISPSEPLDRLGGSLAAHVVAILNGATIIRTHDVAETIQALRIALAIRDMK
jgi:dihydropteroate synthase